MEGVERAKVVSVTDDEGFFRAIVRTFSYKVEAGPQLDALISARHHACSSSTSSSART